MRRTSRESRWLYSSFINNHESLRACFTGEVAIVRAMFVFFSNHKAIRHLIEERKRPYLIRHAIISKPLPVLDIFRLQFHFRVGQLTFVKALSLHPTKVERKAVLVYSVNAKKQTIPEVLCKVPLKQAAMK